MKFKARIVIAIFKIAMICSHAHAEDSDTEVRKYPIMAAYLYNLTQFTSWPANVPADHFSLCVLGDNPFGQLLAPLKNKTARNSNFSLFYIPAPGPALRACDVVFVSSGQENNVKSILGTLQGTPALTVSNIEGFADSGGMVEFSRENTRIAMRINIQAVQNARLSISSKLLSLAHIINRQ